MKRFYWIGGIGLATAAIIASAALYDSLPDQIPTHWNIHGEVDDYGSKNWAAFLMPAAMILMLGLFAILPWLSPKRFEIDTFKQTYLFVMFLCIGVFAYIHSLMLYVALRGGVDVSRALLGGMFLFFLLAGNVMGKVRRNFYVGIRTPWTIASERVWNDTHRLAAWIFVAMGAIGLVLVFASVPPAVSFGLLIVAALIPILYSFVHYKKLERRGEI